MQKLDLTEVGKRKELDFMTTNARLGRYICRLDFENKTRGHKRVNSR